MTQSWTDALAKYKYRFDLSRFCLCRATEYKDWFEHKADGNRDDTMAFEARFRENARRHLEAWYEVVFWKMYSYGDESSAREDRTIQVIKRTRRDATTSNALWDLCHSYVKEHSEKRFIEFRSKLFGSGVSIAATFPAFLCPEQFPMVDRKVFEWSRRRGSDHSYKHCQGPDLSIAQLCENVNDWRFVEAWIEWCRFTARRLSGLTGCEWRARDVEMAVFTDQRIFTARGEDLNLEPLGCC